MRSLLFRLTLGCRLSCGQLTCYHVLETADHLRTSGPFMSLLPEEGVLRLSLVLALHLMNKFVLNLV